MAHVNLKIDGMSCQHCVMNVKKTVDAVAGVSASDVSVGSANVMYDEHKTAREAIVNAVQSAGYKVAD